MLATLVKTMKANPKALSFVDIMTEAYTLQCNSDVEKAAQQHFVFPPPALVLPLPMDNDPLADLLNQELLEAIRFLETRTYNMPQHILSQGKDSLEVRFKDHRDKVLALNKTLVSEKALLAFKEIETSVKSEVGKVSLPTSESVLRSALSEKLNEQMGLVEQFLQSEVRVHADAWITEYERDILETNERENARVVAQQLKTQQDASEALRQYVQAMAGHQKGYLTESERKANDEKMWSGLDVRGLPSDMLKEIDAAFKEATNQIRESHERRLEVEFGGRVEIVIQDFKRNANTKWETMKSSASNSDAKSAMEELKAKSLSALNMPYATPDMHARLGNRLDEEGSIILSAIWVKDINSRLEKERIVKAAEETRIQQQQQQQQYQAPSSSSRGGSYGSYGYAGNYGAGNHYHIWDGVHVGPRGGVYTYTSGGNRRYW